MLLRAAIVMLLLLNLGAAGWWLFQPPARAVATADTVPRLRLLRERNAPDVPARVAAVPVPAAPVADAPPAPAAAEGAAAPAAAAPVCLRFGPFADAAARAAAGNALLGLGATDLTSHDVPARGGQGWKVFLPAQPSRAAAQALAQQLEAAGVRDLFVMTQGEEANRIALGRFRSEAGARRRQAALQAIGVQARVEPVNATPAQAWLEARLPATADPATLERIAPSHRVVDCTPAR